MESPGTPCEVPPLTPGSAKPGDHDGQDGVEPTQQDEVQSPATTVPGEPSPRTGMPPPPPPTSRSSKRSSPPKRSDSKASNPKYDKYKDGSYWKILGLYKYIYIL